VISLLFSFFSFISVRILDVCDGAHGNRGKESRFQTTMEEEKDPVAITVEGDSKKDTKKNKKDADKKDEVCMCYSVI
jgi:hypothetical protein